MAYRPNLQPYVMQHNVKRSQPPHSVDEILAFDAPWRFRALTMLKSGSRNHVAKQRCKGQCLTPGLFACFELNILTTTLQQSNDSLHLSDLGERIPTPAALSRVSLRASPWGKVRLARV